MAFLIVGSALAIVGIIAFMVGRTDDSSTGDTKAGGYLVSGLCAFGFIILLVVCSTHLVAQREVGIVKSFSGTISGNTGTGVVFTAPWQSIDKENTGLLRENFVLNADNSAVSKDQQPIYADLTLNYNLPADAAVQIYKTVGPAWKNTLLDSRVLQDFKEVTSEYTAAEITTKREQLRQDTKSRLTIELAKYGIQVDDFFVTNLDYTDSYKQAINAKNVQVQQALQAEAKVAQAKAEAEQNVALAQGNAQATVVKAKAQATALAEKGKAIRQNPEVLQLEAIDKLNPNATVVICTGTGQGNCPSLVPTQGNTAASVTGSK